LGISSLGLYISGKFYFTERSLDFFGFAHESLGPLPPFFFLWHPSAPLLLTATGVEHLAVAAVQAAAAPPPAAALPTRRSDVGRRPSPPVLSYFARATTPPSLRRSPPRRRRRELTAEPQGLIFRAH
jgi:hypothetical protein